MQSTLAGRIGRLALILAMGAGIIVLAALVPSQPRLALGVGALALAGVLVVAAPTLILVAVFAATFLYWRVGPASLDVSITDAVTVVAILAALPYVPWRNVGLRRILGGLVIYLGLLLAVVLAHPTHRAELDWLHRMVLFGGALIVGAAIANKGIITPAFRALALMATVIATAAMVDSVTSGFDPAYPFTLHKNLAGPLIAMVTMALIAAPSAFALSPALTRYLRAFLVVGVLATQSRGAAFGLVLAVSIYALRHREARRRAPIFFVVVAVGLFLVSFLTLQSEQVDNPKFNGVTLRSDTIDTALNDTWAHNPIFGAGLRYFKDPLSPVVNAEQIFVAELAEAGVIGLIGLLILLGNTLRVLWPRRDPIGETALLVFVLEVLYALTAVFWIAGTLTLAMLFVGLAAGTRPEEIELRSRPQLSSIVQ